MCGKQPKNGEAVRQLTASEASRLISAQEKKGGPRGKYDWDAILDGNWNMMVWKEDFDCQMIAFRERIYTIATERGLKAHVYEVKKPERGWLVQAYRPSGSSTGEDRP